MSVSRTEVRRLSVGERLQFVGDVWDDLLDDGVEPPMTQAQREELDRRVAAHDADPHAGEPWQAVRRRIEDGL